MYAAIDVLVTNLEVSTSVVLTYVGVTDYEGICALRSAVVHMLEDSIVLADFLGANLNYMDLDVADQYMNTVRLTEDIRRKTMLILDAAFAE